MSFDETRFPTDIGLRTISGPGWMTEIVTTKSGYEYRNANWSQSRWKANLDKPVKDEDQLADLIAFFEARQGRARGFRVHDPLDYQVTGGTIIASADGGETTAQLIRNYTSGSVTRVRTIYKPVSGTVTVYINAVEDTGATVDTETGIVTFSSALTTGDAVTADFQFDKPVRFDVDDLQIVHVEPGVQFLENLPIIELKIRSDGTG